MMRQNSPIIVQIFMIKYKIIEVRTLHMKLSLKLQIKCCRLSKFLHNNIRFLFIIRDHFKFPDFFRFKVRNFLSFILIEEKTITDQYWEDRKRCHPGEFLLVAEHTTPHKLLHVGLQKHSVFIISPFHCSPLSRDS